MGRRIRARDVRRAWRIVADCRDAGPDLHAWEGALLDGLTPLIGAQVVISGHMRNFGAGRVPESLALIRRGWSSETEEQNWRQYAGTTPVTATPEFRHLSKFRGPVMTRLRDQIWSRDTWYRSVTYNEVHRRSGIDDYIFSIAGVPELGQFHSLWLHRSVGAPAYTRREWHLVHGVHAQIGRLIGGALASAAEPVLSELSARLRETLDCLLDGDSEKQAAYRMGLSVATVHEYVAALYRHFGVSSRGELMARFVGRARPARADEAQNLGQAPGQ